jgi:hypothetical protein
MTHTKITVALGLAAAIVTAPSYVTAQGRGRSAGPVVGRAVPRTVPGGVLRPPVVAVVPYYRPYYYAPFRPGVNLGLHFGYGYPGFYGAYPWYGYSGYGYPAYGYPGYGYPAYGYPGYGYPGYGYPAYGVAARPSGSVRLEIPQKDAEVYADGYFAGNVDNFDGRFHQLNLEPGPHRIEVRAPGFEPIAFDVNVEPGRSITYRATMRPRP